MPLAMSVPAAWVIGADVRRCIWDDSCCRRLLARMPVGTEQMIPAAFGADACAEAGAWMPMPPVWCGCFHFRVEVPVAFGADACQLQMIPAPFGADACQLQMIPAPLGAD